MQVLDILQLIHTHLLRYIKGLIFFLGLPLTTETMRIGGLREFSLSKWEKRNAGLKPGIAPRPPLRIDVCYVPVFFVCLLSSFANFQSFSICDELSTSQLLTHEGSSIPVSTRSVSFLEIKSIHFNFKSNMNRFGREADLHSIFLSLFRDSLP